jgi:hypothetical protein
VAELLTKLMRVKEGESDYRYFPEPDIPPMTLDSTTVKQWADTLVELPAQKRQRYAFPKPYAHQIQHGQYVLVQCPMHPVKPTFGRPLVFPALPCSALLQHPLICPAMLLC